VAREVKLFESKALRPGASLRFPLDEWREGFALRMPHGTVCAYLNVCPHRLQAVDEGDGRLWNAAGEIECGHHGARFVPATGACAGGPCNGSGLTPIQVLEHDGAVWLAEPEW
jgi:nitrite reductase/ring-hydroxylating ferredoxin subunit